MILSTRPSTAVANPHASCVESSTLPNEWAIGSHRNCRSSSSRMLLGLDGRALVGPRRVRAAVRPWACRSCPRCRSGWPAGRPGSRRSPASTASGFSARCFSPSALEVVEADHPVAVGGAVEDARPCRGAGSSDLCSVQLGDLLVVLGEDDAALGVGQDVGDVLGHRRGVDRGGRARRRTSPRGRPGSTRRGCPRRCRRAARARGPGRAARRRASRPGRRSPSRSSTSTAGRRRPGSCTPRGSGLVWTRSRNWTATLGARFSMKEVSVLTGDMGAPRWARTGPGQGPGSAVTWQ